MMSAIASRLAGSLPRTPLSISWAWMPSSIDSASSLVAGARRKVMSFSTSTSTPPRPNATSLPNDPSVTAPMMTSWPPSSICWTWMPSILASALYFLALARMVVVILFDVGGGLDADHHAAGFGLVQDVRRDDLHHHRKAHAGRDLGGLGGGFGDAFLRNRDAVGIADQLAFRRRQAGALVRLDRIENFADRIFGIRHWLPP